MAGANNNNNDNNRGTRFPDLPKLVSVTRPDGTTVLVPEDIVGRKERFEELRRPGDPEVDVVEFLTRDPAQELRRAEIRRTGRFDTEEFRQRDPVQSFRNVAAQFGVPPERQTTRTPFTDVRRGIAEQVVAQTPSESDILSEADLRLQDLRRRRALGLL